MAGQPEMSEEETTERSRIAFSERSKCIAHKTKRSALLLAANTIVAAMFLKDMPLHTFFQPVGQVLLVTWVLAAAAAGFDLTALIGDRCLKRKLDQIP